MPRNSSGDYSLPAGNPVTTGTPIASTWANGTLSDLATAMTDSLSRSGDGGMLAALEILAGDVNDPGLAFTAETSLGLFRSGAGKLAVAVSASKIAEFSSAGLALTGLLAITGTATISSTLDVAGNFSVATNKLTVAAASGNTTIAGTLGVTGAVSLTSTLGVGGIASFLPGTATNPGISFTGDGNTGISAQTVNTLVLSTAGTARGTFSAASIALAATAIGLTGATSLTGTLAVSGTSTIAALSATTGSFSSTLAVTGVATFTAQPVRASAGGFLYNASSSNGAGTVTISNSVPGSAAAVGSPGAIRLVYV